MQKGNNWKILGSKTAHQNKWFKVTTYGVIRPDQKLGQYNVVDKDDFAVVMPYDGKNFYLVGQYRFPVKAWSWEFIKGSLDPQEPVETGAQRELKEEAGIVAKKLTNYGYFYEANGHSSQGFSVFLAEELSFGEQELEGTELGLEVKQFTVKEVSEMIKDAEIKDSPSIVAFTQFNLRQP